MFLETLLFLLLSFMLASIPLSSSQNIEPYALGKDSANLTCFSDLYPFGTAGIALQGFEISCPQEEPQNSPPLLSISNNYYTVAEISLQGYIKIFAGPIHKTCYDANDKSTESKGSGQFNLDGTPFTLSYQYNMLTVVGCNNLVLIGGKGKNPTSGCVTFCDSQGFSSGSCSGLGCCQATLPGPLKSFDLQFEHVGVISNSTREILNCSAAFLTQRDDFESNKNKFLFQDRNLYDVINNSNFLSHNLIQLDWAIGNKSCEDSRKDVASFVCKNNSFCYDSPAMPGYLCNCTPGYQGNPYVKDGCTGIIHNLS
jgi:Wall-associated kinase